MLCPVSYTHLKDADIARRLDEKINRNRGKKTSDDATQQGDLFAHVYQNPDDEQYRHLYLRYD